MNHGQEYDHGKLVALPRSSGDEPDVRRYGKRLQNYTPQRRGATEPRRGAAAASSFLPAQAGTIHLDQDRPWAPHRSRRGTAGWVQGNGRRRVRVIR